MLVLARKLLPKEDFDKCVKIQLLILELIFEQKQTIELQTPNKKGRKKE